jgi:ribonuclease P protein subunit RPR2
VVCAFALNRSPRSKTSCRTCHGPKKCSTPPLHLSCLPAGSYKTRGVLFANTTMSKVKPPKSKGIPSKHLHARTTFLYQAAAYLTLQTTSHDTAIATTFSSSQDDTTTLYHSQHVPRRSPTALQLGSDLQQVTRKAQLRLSVDLKRTMCKRCNTILLPGRTATQTVENTSRNGGKPWADVLVLACKTCDGRKRFPIGANRQNKIKDRNVVPKDTTSVTSMDDIQQTESAAQTSTELDSNTG